ncbi:hypothetical protein GJ744_010340 [Endocarpon pusillum]|uniref:Fungal N-terminal domain-containing protein n=1 Tax=Endocarpon pusillum TaxID=364733 RepID=A0A8H7E1X6_9EURO|nr:hypothetical protein GJ744_010340 [Endocarpon pusillum]
MAEVIGLISGLYTIGMAGLSLCDALTTFAEGIKTAERDVTFVAYEIKSTSEVLLLIRDSIEESKDSRSEVVKKGRMILESLATQCEFCHGLIRELISFLEPYFDASQVSTTKHLIRFGEKIKSIKLLDKWRWQQQRPKVDKLRGYLEALKSSLSLVLPVLHFEIAGEKHAPPATLESFKDMIETALAQAREHPQILGQELANETAAARCTSMALITQRHGTKTPQEAIQGLAADIVFTDRERRPRIQHGNGSRKYHVPRGYEREGLPTRNSKHLERVGSKDSSSDFVNVHQEKPHLEVRQSYRKASSNAEGENYRPPSANSSDEYFTEIPQRRSPHFRYKPMSMAPGPAYHASTRDNYINARKTSDPNDDDEYNTDDNDEYNTDDNDEYNTDAGQTPRPAYPEFTRDNYIDARKLSDPSDDDEYNTDAGSKPYIMRNVKGRRFDKSRATHKAEAIPSEDYPYFSDSYSDSHVMRYPNSSEGPKPVLRPRYPNPDPNSSERQKPVLRRENPLPPAPFELDAPAGTTAYQTAQLLRHYTASNTTWNNAARIGSDDQGNPRRRNGNIAANRATNDPTQAVRDHRNAVPPMPRSHTMPSGASARRSDNAPSRASNLKHETHDSRYGSSSRATPDTTGTSPPKYPSATRYKIVDEVEEFCNRRHRQRSQSPATPDTTGTSPPKYPSATRYKIVDEAEEFSTRGHRTIRVDPEESRRRAKTPPVEPQRPPLSMSSKRPSRAATAFTPRRRAKTPPVEPQRPPLSMSSKRPSRAATAFTPRRRPKTPPVEPQRPPLSLSSKRPSRATTAYTPRSPVDVPPAC